MNWLLKIVEGPLAGAEIALVSGTRVKVGSGDGCDIIISDQSLPEVAFELDTAGDAVTLVRPDGQAVPLRPFEVRSFGTTAIAVGPADSPWENLVRQSPEKVEAEPAVESKSEEISAEAEAAPVVPEKKSSRSHTFLWIILCIVVFFIAIWYFWPRAVRKWPVLEKCRTKAVIFSHGQNGTVAETDVAPIATLGNSLTDIAYENKLELIDDAGAKILKGNLKRRTERMAIRSLALAADPTVKFDLTDDESLKSSVEDLLFGITEGAVKVLSATNRVVALTGSLRNVEDLNRALQALKTDVSGIEEINTDGVSIAGPSGGILPAAARPFVSSMTNAKKTDRNLLRDFPVAGILTRPYPCIVLRNGLRCTVGAQIGGAIVEKIEADKITLREGDQIFTLEP